MKKYLSIIFYTLCFVGACLLVTYFIDNILELEKLSLSSMSDIVQILSSSILLVLALMLLNKISGSQSIVDSQTKAVIKLVEEIANTKISVDKRNARGTESISYNIDVYNYQTRFEEVGINGERKVKQFANAKFANWLARIEEHSTDPYQPKVIADEIRKKFSLKSAEFADTVKDKDLPFIVNVQGTFNDALGLQLDLSSTILKSINKSDIDILTTLEDLGNLHKNAVKWLSDNNSVVFKSLNIKAIK